MDQIDKIVNREDIIISCINYISIQRFWKLLRGSTEVGRTPVHN
jgi:hypothetical protein